jgi:CRISPR/Cas system-associated exonuclease Cas4 (RecB family)
LIRASEIGTYVYCHRAWWLRTVLEIEPAQRERMERGVAAHRRHGTRVRFARVLLITGVVLLLAAALAFAVG